MGNDNPPINYSSYQYPIYQSPAKPIVITTTKPDYFKDEFVEGNIVLQNQLPIVLNDIYLNLYLLESWAYIESSSQSFGELNSQPLLCVKVGIKNILKLETDLINLSAGCFNFPFKFKLPNYLQPCFEFPLPDKRGYLRYSLEAKFISPYVQGSSSIYLIVKARPKVLNSPLSFSSAMNIHKWGLIDQGTTLLKVSYFTNNYKINDSVPLKIEINNIRGKLKVSSCEIKLVRKVGFLLKNTDKNKYTFEKIINEKVFPVDVQPMNQRSYNYSIELKDKYINIFNYSNVANPYPNLIDLSYAMPSTDGVIIKCEYHLEVTIFFDSFVTSGYLPKVNLPISITHQRQDEYQIEKQEDEDLQKAIEASKLEIQNKNEDKFNDQNNNKNINMSCVDKNRMDEMFDKPNGYDIQKEQPLSHSQLIDNDNNLPSENEVEKNNNKRQMQINEQNNINLIQNNNNNMYNNNTNIRQNNNENNYMNMNINQNNYGNNNLQNFPAPAIMKKDDDDDDLFNPYMGSKFSNNNNNNNNIQMSNIVPNNNFSLYNQNNNNINNYNSNINNNINNNIRNNYRNINSNQNDNNINKINQINNNINNNNQNYNNRQNENLNSNLIKNEINNKYPDYNNFSNINNNGNDNYQNKNKNNTLKTIKDENDFTILNEESNENANNEDNNKNKKNNNFYNINEI